MNRTYYRWFKYLLAWLAPVGSLMGMIFGGWYTVSPLIFAFFFVPFVELLVPPDPGNLQLVEAEMVAKDRIYDVLIWLLVPFQWLVLFLFLHRVNDADVSSWELAGMIGSMGLMCGIVGINVGHELGHRHSSTEQLLAKLLLLSSLYMHFFIEHNRGHHKRVGTPHDPASARYNESLYAFWLRSVVGGYRSAWQLEKLRMQKAGYRVYSLKNEMLVFHLVEAALVVGIGWTLGVKSLLCFFIAAGIGILLLEGVNYIEHYGLARKPKADGSYGRTLHCHSWNSDHVLGRVLLFELSRHSDHHYKASKKYQLLDHIDESPQMPAGYPAMIMLALVPPLWFRVMNPLLRKEMEKMPEIALAI